MKQETLPASHLFIIRSQYESSFGHIRTVQTEKYRHTIRNNGLAGTTCTCAFYIKSLLLTETTDDNLIFTLTGRIIEWLFWLEYKMLPPDILLDYSLADLAQCLNSVERGLGKPDYCSCFCFVLFLLSQRRGNVLMSGVEDSKKKQMQQEEDH